MAAYSINFAEKLKSSDPSTLKCIKFREGNIYYGQVELVEVSASMAKQENSHNDHPEPVIHKDTPKMSAPKGKDEKGPAKDTKDSGKDISPAAHYNENMKRMRHGLGVQIYYRTDGSVICKYEGHWFRGKKHGEGTVTYSDKSVYSGIFKNEVREGKGSFKWANGFTYEGEWKDDMMEGEGVFINPTGKRTKGFFRNNCIMARKGIFVNPFLSDKEMEDFLDKREVVLQKIAKAATPSEKGLIFEVVTQENRSKQVIEFSKEKGRVPLFLSTKK